MTIMYSPALGGLVDVEKARWNTLALRAASHEQAGAWGYEAPLLQVIPLAPSSIVANGAYRGARTSRLSYRDVMGGILA